MQSLTSLYRCGPGPSSSHTMAPAAAAREYLAKHTEGTDFRVTLFGSLAATGRGHLTDKVLYETFGDRALEILWHPDEELPGHPNGIRFETLSHGVGDNAWDVLSVGGGEYQDASTVMAPVSTYPFSNLTECLDHCRQSGQPLWQMVEDFEGDSIWSFLQPMWDAMQSSIQRGLTTEGQLPGGLGISRKAQSLHRKTELHGPHLQTTGRLASYAYAVSEENACGGTIVTAPTCGACGVMPAVLLYLDKLLAPSPMEILHALSTAGLIGVVVKRNASISGAEVGCQGEVGTACAMAAAAATQLQGGSIFQIEYAAEMGLEHHLGLTCDPVEGLVQIPCIERNAFGAVRALSSSHLALLSDGQHKISFDDAVSVMKQTGQDMPSCYRETARGGLARIYQERFGKQ